MTEPVAVVAARSRIAQSYEHNCATWAVQMALRSQVGLQPALPAIALHPPTERQALNDLPGAVAWVTSWRQAQLPGVEWEEQQWDSAGSQEVPVRLAPRTVDGAARIAGCQRDWALLLRRAEALLGEWFPAWGREADAELVRRYLRRLAELSETDFLRLRDVASWLLQHPTSGLFARQIPVRGVDSEWAESHQGLLKALLAPEVPGDLGLVQPPGLIRVRFLDPQLAPSGISDLAAPVPQLDALNLKPRQVLVTENLQSMLALPELPGWVAIHGSDYAMKALTGVRWIAQDQGQRVLYWGDLDTDGFVILDTLRFRLPAVRSVLMTLDVAQTHRDLAVTDRITPDQGCEFARLTRPEAEALAWLQQEGLRIEQERLPWAECLSTLQVVGAVDAP